MPCTNKNAIAIGSLAQRCARMDFSIEVVILEEYTDGVSKIQLQNENGYSILTLTENINLDTKTLQNCV